MRALQILNSPDPGGVLTLSQGIASGVADHGIMVETMFLTPRAGMSPLAKIAGAWRAGKRVVVGDYDAVIAYQAWPSIVVGLASLLNRRPKLIVHQTTIPSITAAPVRLIDRLLGSLGVYPVNVVNTLFTRDEYADYPAAYRRRLQLIEHGVSKPSVTRPRQETLKHHDLPDDLKIMLNTARLADQKNQEVLIRALPALPGVRLVIAGDGPLDSAYRELARDLGVVDRLHLLGSVEYCDVVELYGAADLFVFPSRHETFGISAVEAVLLGIPTLVSDIAVLREVLTIDGGSAVAFVDGTDTAAWQQAIAAWLDEAPSPARLATFAAAMAAKYSEERMIGSYLRLLRPAGRA